ncbi:MAG: glycerophosphodiester phosphodiesterase [Nocardioides sp.]|nr:glycerophosphodiester phosphodiesterase [Nocardioides sp.]
MVAHRGASGHRPEHTLASYSLAIAMGAEYIEPDLVSTRDGVLVARHENEIGGTTDVARQPGFASRRATKVVDGVETTGWFTEDFTLAELKTLRAVERLPLARPGNTVHDGRFEVPTFEEILTLAREASRRTGREIGVYPETKYPSYFAGLGLGLENPLLAALRRHRMDHRGAPVFLQSFETSNLRALAQLTPLPLVQLIDHEGAPADLVARGEHTTYADLLAPAALAEIATYATGLGVAKDLVLPRDRVTGAVGTPSSLVRDAHTASLLVHVWTLRAENQFLPTNFRHGTDPHAHGDLVGETWAHLEAGVDGVFSDFPDLAVAARDGRPDLRRGRAS